MTDFTNKKEESTTGGFQLQNRQETTQNVQKSPSKFSNSFLGFRKTSFMNKTVSASQSPVKENIDSNSNEMGVEKPKPLPFKKKFAGFSIIKKGVKVSPSKIQITKQADEVKNNPRPLVTSLSKMPVKQTETRPIIQQNPTVNEVQKSSFVSPPIESNAIEIDCDSYLSDPIDYTYEEEDISLKDKEFDKSEKDLFDFNSFIFYFI